MKKLYALILAALVSLSAQAEFFNLIYTSKFFCLNEKAGQKATKVSQYLNHHRGVEVSWNETDDNGTVMFEFTPSYTVTPFEELRVKVVYILEKDATASALQIRFRDSKKENFAYEQPIDDLTPGMHTMDFVIHNNGKAQAIWGGDKNERIDGEAYFLGMAVKTKQPKTPGKIFIVGLDFRGDYLVPAKEQLDKLKIDMAERNPVLRNPGDKRPLELHFRNTNKAQMKFDARIVLRDARGDVASTTTKSFKIPMLETEYIGIDTPKRQGLYYVDIQLTDKEGNSRVVTQTFAVMEPYGVQHEFDTGFQLSICTQLGVLEPENRDYVLYLCSLIGCNSLRDNTCWFDMETKGEGKIDYGVSDSKIQSASQYGIIPELVVSFGASWATEPTWKCFTSMQHPNLHGRLGTPLPAEDYFERHIREFCRRFHNTPIFYEIWNEPELPYFANFSPDEYVNLARIVHEQVKKHSPNSKILSAGFSSPGPSGFHSTPHYVEEVLAKGHQYMDIIAIHGHGPFESFVGYIDGLKGIMKKHDINKPWWANESADHSVKIGEYKQAQLLVKKAVYTMGEGGVGYTWYNFRNNNYGNGDPTNGENRFGLVNYDYSPRPDFVAFNTVAKQLRKSTFVKKCLPKISTLFAYQFKAPRGNQLVVWHSPENLNGLYWLKAKSPEIIDIFGNAEKLNLSNGYGWLPTSGVPIFVQDKTALPELLAPVIDVRGELPAPGADGDMTLFIDNPTENTINLEISLSSRNPVIKGDKQLKVAIPKGGKRIPVKVHTNTEFSGTPAITADIKTADGSLQCQAVLPIPTLFPVKLNAPVDKQVSLVIDRPEQAVSRVINAPTNEPYFWKGPDDLSASIQWGADARNLYFKVVVKDDIHDQPYTGWDVWQADNLQIMLRMPNQWQDWELGFTLTKKGPEVFAYAVVGKRSAEECAKLMKLTASRNEKTKTTTYNGTIPWDVLGQKECPKDMRFNLIVNDSDLNLHETQATLGEAPKVLQHYKKIVFVK